MRQSELLRTGEDESPRVRAAVDLDLEVAQQAGCVLDLVEDGAPGVLGEEASWVRRGIVADVQRLEGDVGLVRKDRAAEGRLAGLARPR